MSGKQSDPAQLPMSLYRVQISCEVDSCLSAVSRVKMQHSFIQRYAIKFCVKLEKSTTETIAMIQNAYGKDTLSKSQVFRRHKALREGREDVEDEQRLGRPSMSHASDNVAKVKAVLDSDRRLSVRLIADQVGLPTFYVKVPKRLKKRVARIHPEIANTWVLHHDNAPSHASLLVREFLAKQTATTLPQPPYSPDLAPSGFFLFILGLLKGYRLP
jgi:predicted trehalose synthase